MYWLNVYANTVWKDTEDGFTREFIIVGASKEDIDVSVENNSLRLSFDGNDYSSALSHSWTLPTGISAEDISSTYEAGVLTIKIKKPKDYKTKIPIK